VLLLVNSKRCLRLKVDKLLSPAHAVFPLSPYEPPAWRVELRVRATSKDGETFRRLKAFHGEISYVLLRDNYSNTLYCAAGRRHSGFCMAKHITYYFVIISATRFTALLFVASETFMAKCLTYSCVTIIPTRFMTLLFASRLPSSGIFSCLHSSGSTLFVPFRWREDSTSVSATVAALKDAYDTYELIRRIRCKLK
jgi:hypothetical protein